MDQITIFCAKYMFLLVPLLFVVIWLQAGKKQKKEIALALIIAMLAAVILDKIAAKLYYDPRPFVSQNIKPLITHSADNGFPSEHTLFSTTIATVIFFYRRRVGIAALAVALVVGIARVGAHVHSPIDIFAGLIMGLVAGSAGYWVANKYFQRPKSPKHPSGQLSDSKEK